MPVCLRPQCPKFMIGHSSYWLFRSLLHSDIRIALRIVRTHVQHGIRTVFAVNSFCAPEHDRRTAIRAAHRIQIPRFFLFILRHCNCIAPIKKVPESRRFIQFHAMVFPILIPYKLRPSGQIFFELRHCGSLNALIRNGSLFARTSLTPRIRLMYREPLRNSFVP